MTPGGATSCWRCAPIKARMRELSPTSHSQQELGESAWELSCFYSTLKIICSLLFFPPLTMSGFDSNPFADPVDVNPFQVSVWCSLATVRWLLAGVRWGLKEKTCLVGCWVRPFSIFWPRIAIRSMTRIRWNAGHFNSKYSLHIFRTLHVGLSPEPVNGLICRRKSVIPSKRHYCFFLKKNICKHNSISFPSASFDHLFSVIIIIFFVVAFIKALENNLFSLTYKKENPLLPNLIK